MDGDIGLWERLSNVGIGWVLVLIAIFLFAATFAVYYNADLSPPTYGGNVTGADVFEQVDGEVAPPGAATCWKGDHREYESTLYIEITEPHDAEWNIRSIYVYDTDTEELACVTEIQPNHRFVHIGLTPGHYRIEMVTWDGRVADNGFIHVDEVGG